MTKVSVIVPVRNQEKYVAKAIDSILAQKTDFEIEILIGDDSSTDGTTEILQLYAEKDTRIKLFIRETRLGATRNVYDLCLRMTGEFFAYLEGDDYWCDENKLQMQYDFMLAHPECAGCFHDVRLVDENERPINKKLSWITNKKMLTFDTFDGYHLPGHPSSWFRKNLYMTSPNSFDAIYKINANIGDRTAVMCFLSFGSFKKINLTMSCYRYIRNNNATNLTSQLYPKGVNMLENELEFLNKMQNFAETQLNRKVNYDQRREMIFAESILKFIKKPNKNNLNISKKAYNSCKNKIIVAFKLPFMILYCLYSKLTRA